MTGYWSVPRLYQDQTIVCMASGPNLKDEQVEHVRRARYEGKCRLITCNNGIFKAPWADHFHFADKQWWRWYKDKPEYKNFQNIKTTLSNELIEEDADNAHVVFCQPGEGLAEDPTMVRGNSSGYHCINLAKHYGARRIILMGYEMGPAVMGSSHWHGEHPNPSDPVVLFAARARLETVGQCQIDIVNCSHNTAIKSFRRDLIENVL